MSAGDAIVQWLICAVAISLVWYGITKYYQRNDRQ